MKPARLLATDKAQETGSQKEIASDNGHELNVIGCEDSRQYLHGVTVEVMKQF